VFAHVIPHIIIVPGHAHAELRQISPEGHMFVQLPQCEGSTVVFVHTPEQSVVGPVH